MQSSKINKILEHKFPSLLYGTSNTKFQNDFLEHVVNVCGLHKQEKRMGQKCQKKQLFMEIEFLKICNKVNIQKIPISHF